MLEFKFDWKDELCIGIDKIDNQHKELFRIVRGVEQLLLTRCIGVKKEQLYEIVIQLREYVSYHFYEEEVFMREHNYSGIEEHIKAHRYMYGKVEAIDIPKLGENPYEELMKLKEDIQNWIFEHLIYMDHVMGKELEGKIEAKK